MKMDILKRFRNPGVIWGGGAAILALSGIVFAVFAQAASGTVITTSMHNTSHNVISSANLGTPVHAKVTVATSTNADPLPAGTVDFNVYSNTTCTGTAFVQSSVALVSGSAESNATTTTSGGLSYKAHYNGQTDVYPPSDGNCTPVSVTAPNTVLNTTLSTTSVLAGSSVHDSATLTNATANATGTVAYTVFSNTGCTLGAQNAGVKTVTNASIPNSDTIQFNTPGLFYWQAVYSGDQNNAVATSSCQSEVLAVLATTTPPIPPGHLIVDKVTNPSGNMKSFHFNAVGSGYASFDLTDQSTPNNQALVPGVYRVSETASAGWKLTSATCVLNNAATTSYTPGANLTLSSGDTITCTFTNTKQANSTRGDGRPHRDVRDGRHIDNPGHGGLPPGLVKRFGRDITAMIFKHFGKHDNGNHYGQMNDQHENDDEDD